MTEPTMPERVWCWPDRDDPARVDFWASADARAEEDKNAVPYLRADLALPRPWGTAADLDALPVGSVVRTKRGDVGEKIHDGTWDRTGTWDNLTSAEMALGSAGGLILFIPEPA